MRTKIILLFVSAILFCLGLWVAKARGESPHLSLMAKVRDDNTAPRLAYLGVNVNYDCLVVNVLPDSPAHKAGIRPGDVITSLHGEPVHNDIELHNIMLSRSPGEKTSVAVLRTPAQGMAFNVTLTERTQEAFKTLPPYDVLEKNGPDNPQYFKHGGGMVTVYYFTATWCAPCKELGPYIEKVYKQFNKIPEFRFVAVAISDDKNDRDEYKALVKLRRQGYYSFTVMRDTLIWKDTGVETVPTILVVNKRGFIVGRYQGKDLLPDKCATLAKELTILFDNLNLNNWPLAWL